MVVEITTTVRSIPQEVGLGRPEGMRQVCVANFDNLHVVPSIALKGLIGTVSHAREREVKRALGRALAWPELKVL